MSKLISNQTRIADLGKPRIVIVGGGFGGLEVAKGLNGFKAQVVLFDRFNHHTFQPLLYQVATSGLSTNSIIYPFRRRFASQNDFYFRMGEVTSVHPDENTIETSIGSLKYDFLVLAQGAKTNYYGMEDVEKNSIPLKTVIDSIQLRNRIIRNLENALLTDDPEVMNSLMDFVIVGGGPTGVELAGALAELKKHVFPADYKELELEQMDIHLIEAGPRLLNGMSQEASDKALKYLTEMGVQVKLNYAVKSYDGHEVIFANDEKLISRNMIWAAGVIGNPIPGLNDQSKGSGGRILVDTFNRVKGHENIFAIGDAARMEGDDKYAKGHPMMAPPAIQQGKLLAYNLKQMILKKPVRSFRYFDKGSMATIGRNKAVVDMGSFKTQGALAWFVWMFVHLLSLIGFRNKFIVMFSWFMSYFSYDKSNRLIISRTNDGVT